MIHCVNLNATWDTVLLCDSVKLGAVNRAVGTLSYPGGKGNNAARAVTLLGGKANLFAFCGKADEPACRTFYKQYPKLGLNLLPVAGRNRPCLVLTDAGKDEETVINSPSQIKLGPADYRKLRAKLIQAVQPGDIVTFSGSLPETFKASAYRDLIHDAQSAGAVTMLDCYGPSFKLGVEAKPFLVKPNAEELGGTFGWKVKTRDQVLTAMDKLLKLGVRVAVVTLGERGALVKSHRETLFVAPLPRTRGWNSPVGCGDAFFGGLAFGLDKGLKLEDCLGWATAAAWANLHSPGAVFFDRKLAAAQRSLVRVSRLA